MPAVHLEKTLLARTASAKFIISFALRKQFYYIGWVKLDWGLGSGGTCPVNVILHLNVICWIQYQSNYCYNDLSLVKLTKNGCNSCSLCCSFSLGPRRIDSYKVCGFSFVFHSYSVPQFKVKIIRPKLSSPMSYLVINYPPSFRLSHLNC